MTTSAQSHFGRGLFDFLRDLKAHNDRDWFAANKDRYVADVQEPMLRFITDFGERVQRVSKYVTADPRRVGGSMFRIYRDVRFSKDKSPYKIAATAHFRLHTRTKGESAPGFYVHLEPSQCMGGGGIYHPDPAALKRVRDRIVDKPKEWEAVIRAVHTIDGESLTRPPAGYDPTHRFIGHIKHKDFYCMSSFSDRVVCSSDFLTAYVDTCRSMAPLLAFLAKAQGLSW
jgi:uncharacterized protein (TIGR02453 family)